MARSGAGLDATCGNGTTIASRCACIGVKIAGSVASSSAWIMAQEERQRCAYAVDRTQPPEGGTEGEGFTEHMEEQSAWIVSCDGWLTSVVRWCIVWETLVQRGRACGRSARCRGGVCLPQGRLGFALSWTPPVHALWPRRARLTDPPRRAVSGWRARNHAHAALRGPADGVATRLVTRGTRCWPRGGQAVGSPLDGQEGGAVRLQSEPHGRVAGTQRLAERTHDRLRPHRPGGREQTARTLAARAAIPYGVGRVLAGFAPRCQTRHRAFPCHASQQEPWFARTWTVWPTRLLIAQEGCPLARRDRKPVREKGPGAVRLLGELRPGPVDTLLEPSLRDHIATGGGISIGASDQLHRAASGWWMMVRNRHDALLRSPSYHHQRLR